MKGVKRECKWCGKHGYGYTMMSTDIMHPLNDSGIYSCKEHEIEVWEETFGKEHPSKVEKRKELKIRKEERVRLLGEIKKELEKLSTHYSVKDVNFVVGLLEGKK